MFMCNSCFTQWWQTQLKDHIYDDDTSAHCPGKAISKCKTVYSEQLIKKMFDSFPYKQISSWYENEINAVLFERYLVQADDIRVCPKDGCNYAGVIDDVRGACYDNLICLKCKHTWKDPLHLTKFEEWRIAINDVL